MQYLIALLGFIIIGLGAECGYLIHKNAQYKMQLELNEAAIESQNAAIEQLALDSAKYQCDIESMNEYARAKYDKVVSDHPKESCESKLKELEKALNIYGQ